MFVEKNEGRVAGEKRPRGRVVGGKAGAGGLGFVGQCQESGC